MFVKICGMTRVDDVQFACQIGVNAVGFIFAKSPRIVSINRAKELAGHVVGPLKVGVFANEDIERIKQIRQKCSLDIIQLHGDESPDFCRQLGGSIFKALRVKDASVIHKINSYPDDVKILLDAWSSTKIGGTGSRIDTLLLDQIENFSRIIIAGGVGPENVLEIISQYHPFGVDINSKVEKSPGIKDHDNMSLVMQLINQSK